jgi:AraC-like DNA-binding protein
MLSSRKFLSRDGIEIADVACRHGRGRGLADEQTAGYTIVFVRRGCFVRSADGVESLLDPTLAYCMNPGEEQRYDHPYDHGDDCTSLTIQQDLLVSLWGGEETLPSQPLRTTPEIDLGHRLLLSAARRGSDQLEIVERAITLIADTLEQTDPRRLGSGQPANKGARLAAVDGVREILAANPERSLTELSRTLAVSPHHLSRIFRSASGHTIARHRMRLRTRSALERLAAGENDLARLAADLGFCDQSHLCRVVREEVGETPSALREALASSEATMR